MTNLSFVASKGLISAMTEEPASERPWEQPSNPDTLGEQTGLRRRRRRTRGFHVDSASEDGMYESSEDEPWMPPTPPDDYFDGVFDGGSEDACGSTLLGAGEEAICSPCILPMHGGDQESVYSMERSLSFAESVVDSFGPYRDLCEADAESDVEKAEKVLGRLLTEWYVVGASVSIVDRRLQLRYETYAAVTLATSFSRYRRCSLRIRVRRDVHRGRLRA